jgi:adenylate cyclase
MESSPSLSRLRSVSRVWGTLSLLPREIRLQASIAGVFALLSLPALGAVIAFSYSENVRNLSSVSDGFITRTRDDAVQMTHDMVEPVEATLRLLASAEETTPGFFRADRSGNFLYEALVSMPQIDAIYASFEDGYHRVVTRIDADRRRNDPRIPPTARWHMSHIDSFGAGQGRERHRTFYETWPQPIGSYSFPTTLDIRTAAPQYRLAKDTRALAVSAPFINPDTNSPVIGIGYPIVSEGKFVGVASAQITLDGLSDLLAQYKASPNSITVVADEQGKVLATSSRHGITRQSAGRLGLIDWRDIEVPAIAQAVRDGPESLDKFSFDLEPSGERYVALFSHFGAGPRHWQVLVVTPLADFVGPLESTNRLLIWLMLGIVLAESVLIYVMARQLSRPIVMVSRAIQRIRSLSFGQRPVQRSRIVEIAQLQQATALLESALRSFSLFAPLGLVRDLIQSGKPLEPRVEPRFVTLMFSDVQNFTGIAEQLSPQELSDQASRYFETITRAVAEEGGTIDKFIGDAVMAFWGAPLETDDHAFRACAAVLKASHRMRALNERWAAEGKRIMPVRFGLHNDTVVVGNVGSPERLSYTAMGDGVNVASRFEGLNKHFGTSICISGAVHDLVAERVMARPLGSVAVKGRLTEIRAYELLGIRDSNDPELAPEAAAGPAAMRSSVGP